MVENKTDLKNSQVLRVMVDSVRKGESPPRTLSAGGWEVELSPKLDRAVIALLHRQIELEEGVKKHRDIVPKIENVLKKRNIWRKFADLLESL